MNENSTIQTPKIPMPTLIIGALILYALSLFFFVEQIFHQPPCCDAINYLDIAHAYNEQGFFHFKEALRTFGYPWILSLIAKLSNFSHLPENFLIWFFQSTLYFFVSYAIAKNIAKSNIKLAKYAYLALCVNIFISPYLGITLTDALYTILALFLLANLMLSNDSSASISGTKLFWRLFFIIFLTSFSIIIRPAAIWLLLPIGYYMASFFIERKKTMTYPSLLKELGIFLGALCLGITPLLMQILLNILHYNSTLANYAAKAS